MGHFQKWFTYLFYAFSFVRVPKPCKTMPFHASMKRALASLWLLAWLWYTDCSALRAHAILQTFEFRPIGLHSHVCSGPKTMLFHAGMKRMVFWPWYHRIFFISLNMTNTIRAIRSISPAKLIMPSTSCLIPLPRIASIIRNRNLPPSKAGNGTRFITPRLAESKIVKFKRFITT